MNDLLDKKPPGLLRRVASMFYDTLLLVALLMFATVLVLPFTGGTAVPAGALWYQLYLATLSIGFFTGFWIHGGQTLGMRAWRIRIERTGGGPLRWQDALVRLAASLLSWLPAGLGFVWSAFDSQGRTWHGRLSHTRLTVLPKRRV